MSLIGDTALTFVKGEHLSLQAFDSAISQLGGQPAHFANLRETHKFSEEMIERSRSMLDERLGQLPEDVGIIAFGSLARRELTHASDLDVVAFYHESRVEAERAAQIADELRKELEPGNVFKPPGATDLFGVAVPIADLVEIIGREDDTNKRLTRRVLLLEESVWLSNEELHSSLMVDLVDRYLKAKPVGRTRMARFLLNDLIRYWRTITVDYQAKADENGPYATRYMKLIVSRKFAYASSILPLFDFALASKGEVELNINGHLSSAYAQPATLRFVESIARMKALGIDFGDAPLRAIGALDSFIGLIGDTEWRASLDEAARDGKAREHPNFATGRELARDLELALVEIFFSEELASLARRYLVF